MRIPRKLLISAALALVLLITLLAGLKPKGYHFRNDIAWTRSNGGIGIGPIGIAYTRDSLQWMDKNSLDSGFAIELSVKADKFQTNGIAEILSFWDGTYPEPLIIGQWRDFVIVRVRAINNKKRYLEFGADSIFEQKKSRLIQIVSARSKTVIYVDGIRTSDSIFTPIFPDAGLRGRLILGNSATAGEPWSGELHGLAIYQLALSPGEITLRFSQWGLMGRASLPPATNAAHFFQFKEGGGRVAHDCVATGFDLKIPKFFQIVKKKVLTGPWDDFTWSFSYLADVAVNLIGFMPIGFFMALFLFEVRAIRNWKKNLFLTGFICFCISLSIELIQVYIPTRDSQLSDLICNTLGGSIGGIFAKMIIIKMKKIRRAADFI
jgi:fluoride ion exporter CrcB/FEX